MRAWGECSNEDLSTSLRSRRKSTGQHAEFRSSGPPEQQAAARRVTLSNATCEPRMPTQRRRSFTGKDRTEAENETEKSPVCDSGSKSVPEADMAKPGVCRPWVALRTTGWYLAPQALSCKLGELQRGRVVLEVPSARPVPSWLAIQPRGFVLLEDLALQEPQPGTVSAREDVLRIREKTLSFREESLAAKQEMEAMRQVRDAMARDLAVLQEQRFSEMQKLDACVQRKEKLKEKLVRCSDVIAFTVNTMDRLQEEPEMPVADVVEAESAVAKSLAELDECGDQIYVDSPESLVAELEEKLPVDVKNDFENHTWWTSDGEAAKKLVQGTNSKGTQPRAPLQSLHIQ